MIDFQQLLHITATINSTLTKYLPNAWLMLRQRRRRWINIDPVQPVTVSDNCRGICQDIATMLIVMFRENDINFVVKMTFLLMD